MLREPGMVAHPQRRTEQWLETGDEMETLSSVGGRQGWMILELEANYLLPAAIAGEWKLMDKRFKPNESGVGWIILRAREKK